MSANPPPSPAPLIEVVANSPDLLVVDLDSADALHVVANQAAALLDVAVAGLVLIDESGHARLAASSSEEESFVELLYLQIYRPGPCTECLETGEPVTVSDLGSYASRWPAFVVAAEMLGVRVVHAFPVRLRGSTVGVLTVLRELPEQLTANGIVLAQALADVAALRLDQQSTARDESRAERVRAAVDGRMVIEQAKGVLSRTGNLAVDEAFDALRAYARAHRRGLTDLAREVVAAPARAAHVVNWRRTEVA